MRGAAGNFKRVSLELGGKSPNVIFDDADIEAASKAAASESFSMPAGLLGRLTRAAHEKVYDEVVERLTQRAQAIRIGDPADRAHGHGAGHLRKADEEHPRSRGYRPQGRRAATTGGERVGDLGYFISPAVFADVEHEMRISQEEIFGPVVSVIKFRDEAEALRIANGTAYSLAAGVWSRDIGRVQRFAKKAKAGTVWVNTYGYTDVRLPWGGVRIQVRPRTRHGRAGDIHRAEGRLDEFERVSATRICRGRGGGGARRLTARGRSPRHIPS